MRAFDVLVKLNGLTACVLFRGSNLLELFALINTMCKAGCKACKIHVRLCKGDDNNKTKGSSVRCIRCLRWVVFGWSRNWSSLRILSFKLKVKTSLTDTFGGQTAVRSTGRARLFVKGGVFIQHLIGKLFGTDQNCSFKRGVRLTRVFVRRGSTVLSKSGWAL